MNAYEPTGPLRVTGDRKLDEDFETLGYYASFDELGFVADLSVTYQIPEKEVAGLVSSIYFQNAYIAIELRRLSAKPLDAILKEYKPTEGRGWGLIMQNLGIKPGSDKFQALKKDTESLLKRAQARKTAAEARIKDDLKKLGLLGPSEKEEDYSGRLDYIKKTSKLAGISACVINKDASITLVDRKYSGYAHTLFISDGKGGYLNEIILKPQESCVITDYHHVSVTYKFIGLRNAKVIIEATDKFDARSLGGKIKKQKKVFNILPYRDNQ